MPKIVRLFSDNRTKIDQSTEKVKKPRRRSARIFETGGSELSATLTFAVDSSAPAKPTVFEKAIGYATFSWKQIAGKHYPYSVRTYKGSAPKPSDVRGISRSNMRRFTA